MQHCRLLLVAGLLVASSAFADTIHLRDGQVLKGRVIERADGRLEIEQKNGSRIVDKNDIASIDPDGTSSAQKSTTDTLYLTDGRILRGNVTFSDDAKEVVISNDKGAESRFPRTLVKTIAFRTGKTPPPGATDSTASVAAVTTDDDTEKKWRSQIDTNLAKLRDPISDAKEKKKARDEILELGVFAVNYVKAEIARVGSDDKTVGPVLQEVLKVAELKTIVPARIEEVLPGVCERLIDSDPDKRIACVNEVALNCPNEAPVVLLYLIQSDPVAKVKSICVGQLSILKRYDELAQVLKMHEHGQWRLVAALELGEAGIYIGIPVLIEALKLDGPKFKDVRTLAIEKLKNWTHQGNLGYLPESEDKAERDAAVSRWDSWWAAKGAEWAEKNSRVENAQVSDDDRAKALDRWRDGNKAIADLQKKQDEATKSGKQLDPREITYAYETAAYLFKQAYDVDPTLSTARLSRAIILYEQLGRPHEAEGELKLILNRFAPENAKLLRALATTHLAHLAELEQNWRRAESYWIEVRSLDKDNLDAYLGIGDSWLERALAAPQGADSIQPASAEKSGDQGGRPNPPSKEQRDGRDQSLLRAIQAYKDALDVVDRKQKALRESVSDLGGQTGEVEDFRTGRLISTIREDRDTLIQRAAAIWFRLGRAQSARNDAKEACEAFKAARNLDPKDERYAKAAALWEKIAEEKP